jgi:hypothetical protein
MREVIERYPEYQQTPYGLERLILDLRDDDGVQHAADTIGISRSTVSYWLKKLAAFRMFPAQDRTAILMLLQEVASTGGIDTAATLVAIDPKTLTRAFTDLQPQTEAA